MVKTLYLEETDSTNDFLRHYMPGEDEDMTVVWTDFQRKGRGRPVPQHVRRHVRR